MLSLNISFSIDLHSDASNQTKNPQSLLTKSNFPSHPFTGCSVGLLVTSISDGCSAFLVILLPIELSPFRLVLSLSIPKRWFCRPCSTKSVPGARWTCFNVSLLFLDKRGMFCSLLLFCNSQMSNAITFARNFIFSGRLDNEAEQFLVFDKSSLFAIRPNYWYWLIFIAWETILSPSEDMEIVLWFRPPPGLWFTE